MTTVPHGWSSMIHNHRAAFQAAHHRPWPGSDGQLVAIINYVGTLSTAEETDECILDVMLEREHD